MTKAVQRVLQEALEQQVRDHLGRDHCQRRREEEPHREYRNGYEPKRVKMAEGEVKLRVPQVREAKEGILVAWGITREGHRVSLHLMLGNKESYEHWRELLRDMVRRGLKPPVMITSDGARGLY